MFYWIWLFGWLVSLNGLTPGHRSRGSKARSRFVINVICIEGCMKIYMINCVHRTRSSTMRFRSGQMVMFGTYTVPKTKTRSATWAVGPCATPTTTTVKSWRNRVWVSWFAPETAHWQTAPNSSCGLPFVIRPARSSKVSLMTSNTQHYLQLSFYKLARALAEWHKS